MWIEVGIINKRKRMKIGEVLEGMSEGEKYEIEVGEEEDKVGIIVGVVKIKGVGFKI